jgi:tetratricopeptide (TPR) repeat protein
MNARPTVRGTGTLLLAGLLLFLATPAANAGPKPTPVEADVRAALDEARELYEKAKNATNDLGQWRVTLVKGLAAVQRAEVLLTHHPKALDAAGKRQLRRVKARLQALEKDLLLIRKLEAIRLQRSPADGRKAARLYEATFKEYGLDVGAGDVGKAAERLRALAGAFRDALVVGLDSWVALAPKAKEREWLVKLVAKVDPDDLRGRLRTALAKKDRKALEKLAQVEGILRQPPSTIVLLGEGLSAMGASASAVDLLRRAQQEHPDDFWINFHLGNALALQTPRKSEEAARFYTAALALRPSSAEVRLNLGVALLEKGDLDAALAAFRRAIALSPQLAPAHSNLGRVLMAKAQLDGAIAEYRKAIQLEPNNARSHDLLGQALAVKQDLAGAVAAFRQAIRLDPKDARAHFHLGTTLYAKGDLDGAIAEYQQTIRLDPRFVGAFTKLGDALAVKGRLDEAIACYRKALQIDPPDRVEPYYGLGKVLQRKGQHQQAVQVFKKVISLKPNWAEGHLALGVALKDAGQVRAAVEAFRKAFTIRPVLAEDLHGGPRSRAAGAAALAGCGLGEDSAKLDARQRARLRQQALTWLRADLALWAKRLDGGKPADRKAAADTLRRWQKAKDLAGLRDKDAVARLPVDEREACRKLWAEVGALLQKAGGKKP